MKQSRRLLEELRSERDEFRRLLYRPLWNSISEQQRWSQDANESGCQTLDEFLPELKPLLKEQSMASVLCQRRGEHAMSILPAEFQHFVSGEIASGKYRSEEEVIQAALRLLREHERRRDGLLDDLQQGIDDLDAGKCVTIKDETAHDAFLAGIERRGHERHTARRADQ